MSDHQGLIGILGLTVWCVLIVLCLSRAVKSTRIQSAVLAAAIVDVLVLLTLMLVSRDISGDSIAWHELGTEASEYLTGRERAPVSYVEGKEGYVWILGLIYSVTGPAPIAAIVFSIFCHLLTVVTVAKTTEIVLSSSRLSAAPIGAATFRAGLIAALLPSFVWWTPHVLRESLTVSLVSASLLFLSDILVNRRALLLPLLLGALCVLSWVRGSLGMVVTVSLLASHVYVVVGRSHHRGLLRALLASVLIACIALFGDTFSEALGAAEEKAAGTTDELAAIASSGFPGLGRHAQLTDVIMVTGPRVLVGPFVWEFRVSSVMLLATVELACWLIVVVFAVRGIRLAYRTQALEPISWIFPVALIVAAVILVGLMFTVGNYGILARYRPIATVVLVPFASIGLFGPSALAGSSGGVGKTLQKAVR